MDDRRSGTDDGGGEENWDDDRADRRAVDAGSDGSDPAPNAEVTGGADDSRSGIWSVGKTAAVSVGLVILAFVVGIGGAFALMFGLSAVGIELREDVIVLMVLLVVMQGVGFGVAAFTYLTVRGVGTEYLRVRMPSLSDVAWIVGGLVTLFASLFAITTVLQQLEQETAEHEVVDIGQETPELLLVLVPLSFLVIGPGEELLFRGVIQTAFVEHLGKWGGIGAASIIFALAHLGAYQGAGLVTSIALLFALSLIFGFIYEQTDNLVVPAVVHGAYNAILFLGLYVSLAMDGDPGFLVPF